MKINYIKLKNFRSYTNEQTFVFPKKGSLLLQAQNGMGKSSIFSGVLFCLFGKAPGNIDNLVNRNTGKNLKVEVGFEVGVNKYVCQRYRLDEKNGDELYLYKNGDNITSSKKKDTQQTIQDVIGVNYNTLLNSICFTKENMTYFLAESPTKRLAILDSILNLKEISVWQDKVGEKKTAAAEEQRNISLEIDKMNSELSNDLKLIENYSKEKNDKISRLRSSIANNQKAIFTLENETKEIALIDIEKEEKLIEHYEEVIKNNAELDKRIVDEQKLLQGADDEINEYNKNKIKLIDLKKIDINEELSKIDEYEKTEKENQNIQVEILKLKADIKKEEKEDLTEFSRLKEQIEKTKLNICHTCGQPINKEKTDAILEDLNKKLEAEKERIDNIAKRNAEILLLNNNINEKIKELISQIKKVIKPDFDRATILKNKEIISNIENRQSILEEKINLSSKNNSAIQERIEELFNKKERVPEKPLFTKDYLNSISVKIKNNNDKKNELLTVNKTLEEELYKIQDEKDITIELRTKVEELKDLLKTADKKQKLNDLKIKYYNLFYYLFSNKNDGLKKFIIGKMIPVLNESVAKYLTYFFSDSIKITFDKDLNDKIIFNGKEVDYDDFSSGEKQRLELSVSFSLFFLVKSFFSSTISFLIIDESLDTALDVEGINSALNIVDDLAENNSVLIISHREELKEHFENKITIEKDIKGNSIIKT